MTRVGFALPFWQLQRPQTPSETSNIMWLCFIWFGVLCSKISYRESSLCIRRRDRQHYPIFSSFLLLVSTRIRQAADVGYLLLIADSKSEWILALWLVIHRPFIALADNELLWFRECLTDSDKFCLSLCNQFLQVFVNIHAVHMDPAVWHDPSTFWPERFLDEKGEIVGKEQIIPFSVGQFI